jgi:hypothetical protein
LQDRFQARRLADRMVERIVHDTFTDEDRAFIDSRMRFLPPPMPMVVRTARTRAACRFVRRRSVDAGARATTATAVLELLATSRQPAGRPAHLTSKPSACASTPARVSADDPLLGELEGAQLIVRVQPEAIFPNCPRYIHKMQTSNNRSTLPAPATRRCPSEAPHFNEVPPNDPAAHAQRRNSE